MKQLITRCSSTLTRMLLILMLLVTGSASAWGEDMSIDFESATSTYSDWTFTNMNSEQTTITAHGGSKHGTTAGKASASVTTTKKIANPSSITFYVSKSTTNTTSSNWIVQVSSNGTSWTDVKTQSATSMTKGSWVEVTQSLSAYNNVYVRVSYSGSTAMRCIDDLTLTTSAAAIPSVALSEVSLDFGTVTQNEKIEAKTIQATISNVSSATIALSGDGASAFTLDKTTLTASGDITITPNTSAPGTYNATLTLSATGAAVVSKDVKMVVEAAFDGSTITMSAADDANIKFVSGSSNETGAIWATSTPLTYDGITLGGSVTSGTNYSYYDGSFVRFYTNNNIVITPATGVSIVKIEIVRSTSTSTNTGTINCSGLKASSSNTTTNTNVYTGLVTSAVTFTATAQARFTSMKVYYSTASAIPSLSAPTNLQSSSVTATTASLSWDAVENATGYKVKIGSTEYDANTNSYSATGLTGSTQYTWTVKAIGNGTTHNSSDYATAVNFTTLAPNVAPTITTQLASTTYNQNATATALTVAASGNPTPTYQWYSNTTNSNENGTVITGETNTTYTPSTTTAGTFYYYCVATNSEGSAKSNVATITVNALVAPSFTTQPQGAEYIQNATATALTVEASGNPAPTYQWYSNSSNSTEGATAISGATSASYSPSTATVGTTYYYCVATNSEGSAKSNVATITVNAVKTLIGIEVAGTPAEFWKGDAFSHDGMTVTATWDDESETDVTSESEFSTPDMSTAGQKTVTVTYKGETDTYNIEVKTIENTQATAYSIAAAIKLINAGKDLSTEVYVMGTISKVVTAWSDQYSNITYNISQDGAEEGPLFQLFRCKTNGAAVGDDVIAKGKLTKFNSTYEFASGNSIVAITKATTLSIANIAVKKGEDITPVIETNIVGEYVIEYASDNENVVIAADDELTTGDQTGTATITATIAADGYKVATTTFTVTVTSVATLSSIVISGNLTKSTYTVGDDFDFSGLSAMGHYSDESTADLTSTVTWTVEPSTLNAATTSVTVKATSGEISGTKAYAVTVNKKTTSISIANMEIGKTDTNVEISATTTPENAALTYSIVSGSEYVSLSEGKVSAVAPGEATLKASYAGNDEYAPAEASFTVTVSNQMIAKKESFSTGDNSGSHNFTNNTDISFEAFKGNASTAPAINSSCLRLYQGGSYVAISGVKGVKIQSITLTTGSAYASTTVGYCVDNGDAPTTGETVAKSSEYAISGLNNQSISIYCLGTDKNTRLDIASLSVKYIKETVTLSSIAVSGEYKTSFIKNSEFNHTGAVVTATFSDGDEQDVTSSAVFSEPDMTTTGEKTVTVRYTHEGVEKTTSYTINVAEEVVESIALSGEYTKVFKTSDTFSHEGVVVTATYNSGRTAAVEDAEFSTPDLSTTGTKTVTVTYAEKTATYDIKVIPATAVFFESFDGNDGTGGNDDKWSGSIAANDITSDNDGWTFASEKGANQCAKFGTGSAAGSAKTPAISLTTDAKITFKAAAWYGNSEVTTLNLSATSGTLSQKSVVMAKAAWTEFTVYLTGVVESTQITFAASQSSNNRFFLDEVLVETAPSNGSLTLVAQSGENYYATFSGDRAVEFVDAIIYTISQNGNNLVLNEVENKQVPANTGVLIKSSDATVQYTYLVAASDLGDNLLYPASKQKSELENHRFYALTYASSKKDKLGFYYINEGGASFKSKDGTAYLAIPKESQISGSRGFSFEDMEDGNETGLKAIVDVVVTEGIYNMEGKKLDIEESALPKGIYLVNGKKIVKF